MMDSLMFFSNDGWTENQYGNEQTLTINRGNDESKIQ